MIPHPAAQAQHAAKDTACPHATAASAVELLLLALLQSLLTALLVAAPAPHSGATRFHIAAIRQLVALIARLRGDAGPLRAHGWIPRCQRHDEGERQIILALIHGRRPRPRSCPAAMPPARPRCARAPPRPAVPGNSAEPPRIRAP